MKPLEVGQLLYKRSKKHPGLFKCYQILDVVHEISRRGFVVTLHVIDIGEQLLAKETKEVTPKIYTFLFDEATNQIIPGEVFTNMDEFASQIYKQ